MGKSRYNGLLFCTYFVTIKSQKAEKTWFKEETFMDKQKTGNLIREARQNKNYTQSELGELLGVTNKAISRWENGDSFPDISVLENLSVLLDLPIQDIVTGERSADGKQAVTEVVRLAKQQERRKKRQMLACMVILGILLYCCMIGYGFGSVYVVSLALVLGLLVYVGAQQSKTGTVTIDRRSKQMTIVCSALLLVAIVSAYVIMMETLWGNLSRVVELINVGPALNAELILISLLNAFLLVFEIYRIIMERTGLHPGCVLAVTTMYVCAGYRDILFHLDSPVILMRILNTHTGVYLAEGMLGIGLLLYFRKRKRKK